MLLGVETNTYRRLICTFVFSSEIETDYIVSIFSFINNAVLKEMPGGYLEVVVVEFIGFENLRLTDRNRAGGVAVFEIAGGEKAKADFSFYLQLSECLSIRLNRHDKRLSTAELEKFIRDNRQELKKMVQPDVERLRRQKRKELYGVEEFNNPHKNLP